MSGFVFFKSLFDGRGFGIMGGPLILLVLSAIFIVADVFYLKRIIVSRIHYKSALRSNVVHQFRQHITGRNNYEYDRVNGQQKFDDLFLGLLFDCILDLMDNDNVTKDLLAEKMQISPRQLDMASKKATGLPAMKVMDIVRSQYGM